MTGDGAVLAVGAAHGVARGAGLAARCPDCPDAFGTVLDRLAGGSPAAITEMTGLDAIAAGWLRFHAHSLRDLLSGEPARAMERGGRCFPGQAEAAE